MDFDGAFGMHRQRVMVPPQKLMIGLANGWAAPPSSLASKMLYVDGDAAGRAFREAGGTSGLRGFAYWDIADDSAEAGLAQKLARYVRA